MLVHSAESCPGQHDEALVCLWQAPGVLHHVIIRGIERRRVQVRSLICYWAVRELGMSVAELARRFEQRTSTVTYTCRRGEQMAIKQNYQLFSNKN